MQKLCVHFIVPFLIGRVKGDECNRCPPGWSAYSIGTSMKCLYMSKSKVEISKLETFCQQLNATVPYPKTKEENQNYLDAFETRNVTTSVAIRSCHGIVELKPSGDWNPFPTKTALNAVCEKAATTQTGRVKRQVSSGFIARQDEKFVKKCSLSGAKHILVDERIYCANKNEIMNQTRALEYCRERNATLPLPISLLEFEVFSNFSGPEKAWIGINDPLNSGKKENWKDIENKQPAYVKTTWVKTEPNGDGTAAYYNRTGVYDADKMQKHHVVCVQKVTHSSEILKTIYVNVNETSNSQIKQVKRTEICSLKNAIDVSINGKLVCLAHIGQAKHKDALQLCQSLNATLSLPKSIKENDHFIDSFKRLGIDKKMKDFSTKIVLDVRRLPSINLLSLVKDTFKNRFNGSLSFENWALGQPNNFGNDQNFVSISYPNFKWGDWSGDTVGEVICQQEIKGGRKIQSGGVIMSKQPDDYLQLNNWTRTVTCYSGLLSYRNESLLNIFLVSFHTKKLTFSKIYVS